MALPLHLMRKEFRLLIGGTWKTNYLNMELLEKIVEAHGGRALWEKYSKVTTTMVSGGTLLNIQQIPQNPMPRTMTVWLHEQHSGIRPFGPSADLFSDFTPQRVAVESDSGKVITERTGTTESLHEAMKHGIWGPLGLATFNGYAMWQYMNMPFFMLFPGVSVKEIEPWNERGEIWRVLEVTFPDNLMAHTRVQQFYFGPDYLLRRQDYIVDVAVEEKNTFNVAQYVYDYREVQGFKLPTVRRMYRRNDDGSTNMLDLVIWIDLSEIEYHK